MPDQPTALVKPLDEAVARISAKTPIGSKLRSKEWAGVPVALRERAMFSAGVESVRLLASMQDELRKAAGMIQEQVAHGEAYVDRSVFIAKMRERALNWGVTSTATPDGSKGIVRTGDVTDIRSAKRLGLIYDTQMRQAADFARFKMGQDPDVLDAYPAWRFIRVEGVENPREEHAGVEGQVRLKSDLDFWTGINADFGVPYGPWGWGCGHDVEDVSREECESLGLLKPGEPVAPAMEDFNDKLEASAAGMNDMDRGMLKGYFGDQVQFEGDRAVWQGNVIGDLATELRAWGDAHDWPTEFDSAEFKDRTLHLGESTPRAQAMAKQLGRDLSGAELIVPPDHLYHAQQRHFGKREKAADQQGLAPVDMDLIPHVWRDPDRIELSERKGAKGERSLVFHKELLGDTQMVAFDQRKQNQYYPVSYLVRKGGESPDVGP
jgi:hypothetical protein